MKKENIIEENDLADLEERANRIKGNEEPLATTHGIVHAGFRGFRRFMARKKSRCTLIGNCLVIPHDTIP